MKLFIEPRDVDFSTRSTPLTDEEHKEISEFIRKSKTANAAKETRRAKLKTPKTVKAK